MKKGIIGLSVVLAFFLIFSFHANGGAPLETIQTHASKLIDVLRDPALKAESSRQVKEEKIWTIADSIFDHAELSRRTLGRNWRKLNSEQQKEFTHLFSKLLGSVYMDRIMAYKDEKVVFDKENMVSGKKAEVQSKVITASKEIPIHYRMILKSGKWKVYDVVVEGVSLINNYRSQFNQILISKPPEHLLQALRKKVGST